jgi:hypothetical protein
LYIPIEEFINGTSIIDKEVYERKEKEEGKKDFYYKPIGTFNSFYNNNKNQILIKKTNPIDNTHYLQRIDFKDKTLFIKKDPNNNNSETIVATPQTDEKVHETKNQETECPQRMTYEGYDSEAKLFKTTILNAIAAKNASDRTRNYWTGKSTKDVRNIMIPQVLRDIANIPSIQNYNLKLGFSDLFKDVETKRNNLNTNGESLVSKDYGVLSSAIRATIAAKIKSDNLTHKFKYACQSAREIKDTLNEIADMPDLGDYKVIHAIKDTSKNLYKKISGPWYGGGIRKRTRKQTGRKFKKKTRKQTKYQRAKQSRKRSARR